MRMDTKPSGQSSDSQTPFVEEPAPPVDALIGVHISKGGLEASLFLEPPSGGGAPPTLKAMESALSENGVSYNIDSDKLSQLESNPIYYLNVVVARALEPVDGTDATASFLFQAGKKELRPKENEDGIVDYRDLGVVDNVKKGQTLCVLTPPTEGIPGISVVGKALGQRRGKPLPNYLGKNTELSEDGLRILSTIDGQVDFTSRRINVNETFYVNGDVGNSTGDVVVVGNLVVRGMVKPGFRAEAKKNIQISGAVENASLRADGNISLLGGANNSVITCKGDLKSRFIENCTVLVHGEIRTNYVLSSAITCGRSLKTEGSIARILGGSCLAGENIEARTIGSASNAKTKLELGTSPLILERQRELGATIPALEKQIESLRPLVTLLRDLDKDDRLTPEKKKTLLSLAEHFDATRRLLDESRHDLEEITQDILRRGYGRVICPGTVYPGTSITIGTASIVVSDALLNSSFYYNEGEICLGPAR